MPHVTPGRFSDKTDKESKLYAIDWSAGIGTDTIDETTSPPLWSSEPPGLQFSEEAVISGSITQVRISGGARGQSYRVRCLIKLNRTGEDLEPSTNDEPGIPLQILGKPAAREGYLPGSLSRY